MESKEITAMGASAEEDTIDLMEIFRALRKWWYWIVLLAIIFGAALGVYGKFIVKDAYQAEASMCIIDSNKEVSMSDVQLGSALTGDYEGIIKSRVVLNKVIENLKLDLTYKQLYNIVSVENPDSTRILKIYVTAGTVREDIYDLKYEEAKRVINGLFDKNGYKDKHFFPFLYELDNRKEWTQEENWYKANPGLGTIKNLDTLRAKVKKALNNPMLVKNLVCKEFNIRETSSESWMTFEDLDNTATFDIKELCPKYGIGGNDLSATTDLTNATLLFMVPDDKHIYVEQMYWLPEDLLEQRVREDKIPYDLWLEQGWLRTCPGNKVHYKHVVEWYQEMQEKYDIYLFKDGYDSWSATYFVEDMKNTFGADTMEAVIQGKKTLSSPMKSLGADLAAKRIVYQNNPILKWCLANTAVDIDKNNNIQPCKGNSPTRRIDGLAGLLDAYVVLENHLEEYQSLI